MENIGPFQERQQTAGDLWTRHSLNVLYCVLFFNWCIYWSLELHSSGFLIFYRRDLAVRPCILAYVSHQLQLKRGHLEPVL